MKNLFFIFFLIFSGPLLIAQQYGRLESEYKLAVPKNQRTIIWDFLQNHYTTDSFRIAGVTFGAELAREKFIDQYFDTKDRILSQNNSGVRYRQRFQDNSLLKELIQLKLPSDTLGLTRNEIKFDVDSKQSGKDMWARHPFLKYLKRSDQESLNFQISHLLIKSEDLRPAIRLLQYRDRIYISDTLGSMATITLDRVKNLHFPYQGFVEMEIELNEIRYTEAEPEQKLLMDSIRDDLKSELIRSFPDLKVDQTPKYNKMEVLVNQNPLSWLASNFMWLIFGGIVLSALILKFKR